MRSNAARPASQLLPIAKSLAFAAGVVTAATTWPVYDAAIKPDVVPVTTPVALAVVFIFQGAPTVGLFVLGEWARRRGPDRLHAFRAITLTAAFGFVALDLGGEVLRWALPLLPAATLFRVVALLGYLGLTAVLVRELSRRRAAIGRQFTWTAELIGACAVLVFALLVAVHHNEARRPVAQYEVAVPPAEAVGRLSETPVFFVVFDELSQNALLDASGRIDAERYPNFARLASNSAVFTDANANYLNTHYALPALAEALTGIGPVRSYLQYRVAEASLAPACGSAFDCRGVSTYAGEEQGAVFRHLLLSATARLVPEPWQLLTRAPLSAVAALVGNPTSVADPAAIHLFTETHIDRLLEDLTTEDPRGAVYLVHTLSSHYPYVRDASGAVQSIPVSRRPDGLLAEAGFQLDSPAIASAGPHGIGDLEGSYRDQIAYADTLLGRLLDELESSGWFERSIVVVTSDHGVRPEFVSSAQPHMIDDWIVRVPLIVHAPGLGAREFDHTITQTSVVPGIAELLEAAPTDWGEVPRLAIEDPDPGWFLAHGHWLYHPGPGDQWTLAGYRASELPIDRADVACFAHPDACPAELAASGAGPVPDLTSH